MSTATTITLHANTVVQSGTGVTVTGAGGVLLTALSDGSDASYISFSSKCRLHNQTLTLGFPDPTLSLPAGAQIVNVTLKERIQTVATGTPPPQCIYYFRCGFSPLAALILTLVEDIFFDFHTRRHPVTTTPVWTTDTVFSRATDPAGNPWTSDSFANFVVELGRDDDNGTPRNIAELILEVTYQQQPGVTVTAPTGTITATGTPAVVWTYNSPDFLPQRSSRVAIYSHAKATAVGFSPFVTAPDQQSGWRLGEDQQWIIPQALVNGVWHAYVQVAQTWDGTAEFLSAIATTSWTQAITGCPDPVLSSAIFDPIHNRIRLQMVPSSSSPTTAVYQVFRSDDNGNTFNLIRFGANVPATGMTPVTVDDYEAPLNKPAQYKVLAFGLTSGVYFPSANYSSTLTVTPTTGSDWWLKDYLNPGANTRFPVAYLGDKITQSKNYGVFDVLGSGDETYKVVVEGSRFGIEGTFDFICHINQADDYWTAIDKLDKSRRTLLLQYPTGEQRAIRLVPGEQGGDKSWIWDITQSDDVMYRKGTIPYVEVRPLAVTAS